MANRLKNLAKMIHEKSKEKSPEEDFLFMLEEAIVRIDKEEQKPPSQSFKPSSIGGCLRKVYYEVIGAPLDQGISTNADSVGISDSGKARHEKIQSAVANMKRLGYPVQWVDIEDYLKKRPQTGTRVVERQGMETKLFNDILNMSFLCDGIFTMHGVYYVLEIKTEMSIKYQKRKEVEDMHITQGSCYSATLGIDKVLYIYENRDICGKKSFFYAVTEADKFNRVIAPIEYVNTCVESETTPPKTTIKRLCNYCKYKDKCERDGEHGSPVL
jgi:CRISPR/Cas system-associated exonuclease Cas4 (RecB family)